MSLTFEFCALVMSSSPPFPSALHNTGSLDEPAPLAGDDDESELTPMSRADRPPRVENKAAKILVRGTPVGPLLKATLMAMIWSTAVNC